MNSLFGWSNMIPSTGNNTGRKEMKFENLFRDNSNVNKIIIAVDGSGSTSYTTSGNSFDGLNFSQIYAKALNHLHNNILTNISETCEIYGWSDSVRKFSDVDKTVYFECLKNGLPFVTQIPNLDGGTQPSKLLPNMTNVATVLITDGEIPQDQVRQIQTSIKTISSGPVFLIVVPHIDSYKNLYAKDVEATAINNINISIPQAFAEKLATVLIWNHKKSTFELIKELTAPWLLPTVNTENLSTLFGTSQPLPLIRQDSYLIKINDSYKTFSIPDVIDYVKNNTTESIENIVNKLIDYKISDAIIQQGNVLSKESFNAMCMTLFNKGMDEHMKTFKEEEITTTSTGTDGTPDILDLIKASARNASNRSKLENEYIQKYKTIFNKLMIDKTVGEVNNIAAAKTLQTRNNVKNFQQMNVTDKLAEISSVLPVGDCSICASNTNIFKTVNIPSGFLTYVSTAINSREITRRKKQKATIKILDVTAFKNCLASHKPTLHCLDLCHSCANITMSKAKRYDDPEYGITGIIPQNIVNGVALNRLMLLPLIDPKNINEYCNPNEPKLSFCRQAMRGFISRFTGLDVTGQDTMIALLMFLTCLANDKETAILIYASQLSILMGGARNQFNETVGRLFKPTLTPISSQILTKIMAVENVVELAGFNVLPESRRLLLLCLLERKISPLLHAKRYRDKSLTELTALLTNRSEDNDAKLISSYNFTKEDLEKITSDTTDYLTQYNSNISYNVQRRGIHIDQMIKCENNLKKIVESRDVNDLADSLELDQGYLKSIIEKCGITDVEFINIIPNFINDIVSSENNTEAVMNVIIDHIKNFNVVNTTATA